MAKPIFTVGLPMEIKVELNDISKVLSESFKDYNVLVYTHDNEDIKFDCFYEKDFNKVKYQELKQIIKERIEIKK